MKPTARVDVNSKTANIGSYSGLDNRKNRKVRKHGNKLDVFKDYYTDSSMSIMDESSILFNKNTSNSKSIGSKSRADEQRSNVRNSRNNIKEMVNSSTSDTTTSEIDSNEEQIDNSKTLIDDSRVILHKEMKDSKMKVINKNLPFPKNVPWNDQQWTRNFGSNEIATLQSRHKDRKNREYKRITIEKFIRESSSEKESLTDDSILCYSTNEAKQIISNTLFSTSKNASEINSANNNKNNKNKECKDLSKKKSISKFVLDHLSESDANIADISSDNISLNNSTTFDQFDSKSKKQKLMSNAFDEKDSRIRRILSFKETDKQIISKKVLTSDSDVNDIQFNSTHSNSRYNSRLMTKNKQHYINDSNLKRDISSDDDFNKQVYSIQGKSSYNRKSRTNTPKENIQSNHEKNQDKSSLRKSRYNLKSRSNTPKANISLHHKKNSFNHSKKKINSNEDISSEDESNMHVDSIQGKSRSNTPKANISLHHKNNSLNDSNKKINSNDDITSDNDKSSYNRKSSHHFISKKTKKKNIASIHKTPGKHDRKQINANNNHNENDIMTQLTAKYSNKGNNSIQTGSNKKSQEHNSSNNDSNVSIKNNNKKMRSNKEILSGEIESPIDLSPSEDQHLRNLNYIQVKSRNPNKESPVQHSIPIVDVHKDKNVMETPRRSPNFKSIEDLQRSTSKKNCDLRRNVLLTQASNIITPRQLIPSESDPVSNPMLFSPIISSNTNKKMTNFKDRMIAINTGTTPNFKKIQQKIQKDLPMEDSYMTVDDEDENTIEQRVQRNIDASDGPVHYFKIPSSLPESPDFRPNLPKFIYPESTKIGLRRSKRTRLQTKFDPNSRRVIHYSYDGTMLDVDENKYVPRLNRKKRNMVSNTGEPNKSLHLLPQDQGLDVNFLDDDEVMITVYDYQSNDQQILNCISVANTNNIDIIHIDNEKIYSIQKFYSSMGFSVGRLTLFPMKTKELANIDQNCLSFFVEHGVISVNINSTNILRPIKSAFLIPPGNNYSLRNLRNENATLIFTQYKI